MTDVLQEACAMPGPQFSMTATPWKLAVWHLRDEEGKLDTVGAKYLALNPQYLSSLK